ncbi:protein TolR [Tahibacter caeni]|uniref:protein TolR n=1 Tax=Tahibacter caeni TaxID=1453545 RepID=UPI0021475BD4|nr:protein TolR [Tahibacter caeni]
MQSTRRKRKKLKSEINVVPYIDVMLVLLIIFMVTAPLLNLGVDIDLPESEVARSLNVDKDPVVVTVDQAGRLYLTIPKAERKEVTADALKTEVAAYVRSNPKLPVYVAGDGKAEYAKVYDAMALLQAAGVPKVGLMGQPPQDKAN